MAAITWKKANDGTWVVTGPTGMVRIGTVTVTKRDGTKQEVEIERLGKPFGPLGQQNVYGYPKAAAKTTTERAQNGGARSSYGRFCSECGERITPGSTCWETGMRH